MMIQQRKKRKRITIPKPEKFIGKLVQVKVQARDNYGKVIPNAFNTIIGECGYCGRNEFLDIPLVAIINRTPVELRSIFDMKIIEDRVKTYIEKYYQM